MKSAVGTMPDQGAGTAAKPVISSIAAELFVADIKRSCDFFTQKLGFSIVFSYGEPPFYAQVKRDRALLNLKCVDYPVIDPALRDRESLLSADMGIDTHEEIKQLFLEFQAAGVTLLLSGTVAVAGLPAICSARISFEDASSTRAPLTLLL